MSRIEKFTKVKGFNYRVIDRFKGVHFFKTYREALAFCIL